MRRVPLANTKSSFALVDDEDYSKTVYTKWNLVGRGRVKSTKHPQILLHTLVMGRPPSGFEWDHRNNCGLDNRRSNLRLCTRTQNNRNQSKRKANRSGYKGVCWHKGRSLWVAQINGGLTKHIGYFSDPIEAARAYDKAARKLYEEFAVLNFPDIRRFPRIRHPRL